MNLTWQTRADAGAPELSSEDLDRIHARWRAANYLSVGQIYLLATRCCADPLNATTSSHACSATGEPHRA